jgi:hypothetical protein
LAKKVSHLVTRAICSCGENSLPLSKGIVLTNSFIGSKREMIASAVSLDLLADNGAARRSRVLRSSIAAMAQGFLRKSRFFFALFRTQYTLN